MVQECGAPTDNVGFRVTGWASLPGSISAVGSRGNSARPGGDDPPKREQGQGEGCAPTGQPATRAETGKSAWGPTPWGAHRPGPLTGPSSAPRGGSEGGPSSSVRGVPFQGAVNSWLRGESGLPSPPHLDGLRQPNRRVSPQPTLAGPPEPDQVPPMCRIRSLGKDPLLTPALRKGSFPRP